MKARPDGSLGGLFAAQVVEYFQPDYLLERLAVAFRKLRPGSRIVLETLNPACWFAFFDASIRDITHVRPLHPETLEYLVTASGFQWTLVQYSSPIQTTRNSSRSRSTPRGSPPSSEPSTRTASG